MLSFFSALVLHGASLHLDVAVPVAGEYERAPCGWEKSLCTGSDVSSPVLRRLLRTFTSIPSLSMRPSYSSYLCAIRDDAKRW